MARSVLLDMAKLALTLLRKGANLELSTPTSPRQRSWVRFRVNCGSRSLRNELLMASVTHPVRPGFLACSKSYVRGLVLMLSTRNFRASTLSVSPGLVLALASKV
jgi:hypothetical protein